MRPLQWSLHQSTLVPGSQFLLSLGRSRPRIVSNSTEEGKEGSKFGEPSKSPCVLILIMFKLADSDVLLIVILI